MKTNLKTNTMWLLLQTNMAFRSLGSSLGKMLGPMLSVMEGMVRIDPAEFSCLSYFYFCLFFSNPRLVRVILRSLRTKRTIPFMKSIVSSSR